MKGHVKVVGTNNGSRRLENASGPGTLTHIAKRIYYLEFQNETFYVDMVEFLILEEFIEFSAWIGSHHSDGGKIAVQFTPSND